MKNYFLVLTLGLILSLNANAQDSTNIKHKRERKSEFGFSASTFLVPKLINDDLIIINDKQKLSYGANLFFNRHITKHFGYSLGLGYLFYDNRFTNIYLNEYTNVLDTMRWHVETKCYTLPIKLFFSSDYSKINYLTLDISFALQVPILSKHEHTEELYYPGASRTPVFHNMYSYNASFNFVHRFNKFKSFAGLTFINTNRNIGTTIGYFNSEIIARNHFTLNVGLLF